MRLALLFLVACSSSPKSTTPTSTPVTTTPDPEIKQPPESPPPDPVPPTDAVSANDLEVAGSPAGGQAQIAAQKNQSGIDLMRQNEYAKASSLFREAVARVPDPAYFFNLCVSLYQEGRFGEALTSCNGATNNNPTAALREKTIKMADRVKAAAKSQNIDVE